MLVVTIRRHSRSDAGTQGSMTLADGSKDHFDTLEPRDCIAAGSYSAYIHRVPAFNPHIDAMAYRRVYQLQDVKGHDRPDIDFGQFAGDRSLGLYNDMLGAIAVGLGFTRKLPPNGTYRAQLALQNSRNTLGRLMARTHGSGIIIDIIDP